MPTMATDVLQREYGDIYQCTAQCASSDRQTDHLGRDVSILLYLEVLHTSTSISHGSYDALSKSATFHVSNCLKRQRRTARNRHEFSSASPLLRAPGGHSAISVRSADGVTDLWNSFWTGTPCLQ